MVLIFRSSSLPAPTKRRLEGFAAMTTMIPDIPEEPPSPATEGEEPSAYQTVTVPMPAEVMSLRSRASSIVSTSTKTSITTLPQPAPSSSTHPSGSIDVLLGQRNFRITARPGSVLSIVCVARTLN